MQPFDGDRYDQLFEDVFLPAIENADVEAYRVDRDPSISIPIEHIEKAIKASDFCFAEITSDNPNVWFELGYALAHNKEVILVCNVERTRYPFDIQHRNIISYKSNSPSDFKILEKKICDRAKAILVKSEKQKKIIENPVKIETSGFDPYEITCLATIAAQMNGLDGSVGHYEIKENMKRSGYNSLAVNLALGKLLSGGLVSQTQEEDDFGNEYQNYIVNSKGWHWISQNLSSFNLERTSNNFSFGQSTSNFDKEDIPF